jgi:hypothetical protein
VNELFRNTDPEGVTDVQILDADDPTPGEAHIAFTLEQRIKLNIGQVRTLWIQIAEDLYKFWNGEMWVKLGLPTFDAWLAGPDIELGRRAVYRLIEIHRELVVNRGVRPGLLADVPVSKLQIALPAIRRGFIDIDDALADCRALGRDDLRDRMDRLSNPEGARKDRAGALHPDNSPANESGYVPGTQAEPPPPPQFAAEEEPEWAICHVCGSKYRVQR